jgi:hypothetical protein
MEKHLSYLWETAWRALLPLFEDRSVLDPIRLKANFWENPSEWSEQDVSFARIELIRVRSDFDKYISAEIAPQKTRKITKKATKKKASTKKRSKPKNVKLG